jgi:nitric oxide reductase NorQ protein
MSAIHTKHTALMTSTGTSKAIFTIAHPAISAGSPDFTNPMFASIPDGSLFVATFRFSGTRRYILNTFTFSGTIDDFTKLYTDTMRNEAAAFAIRFPELERKYFAAAYETVQPQQPEQPEQQEPAAELLEPTADLSGGTWVGEIYMRNRDIALFQYLLKVSASSVANILMVGPSGCGKTTMLEAIAAANGMKFLRMNCAVVRDPEEWFGYREARGGETVFVPTDFTNTIREGNCIVVLDEFNRVEPWLHNSLMPLLDHAGATTVHGETIKRGPKCLFVATINRGSRFTGTFMLDAAVTNRMSATIYVDHLESRLERQLLIKRVGISNELAERIVRAMVALRAFASRNELDVDVSTRSSLKVAEIAAIGMLPLEDIFSFVVLNLIDDTELVKGAIDAISSIIRS